MTERRQALGKAGEDHAAARLAAAGLTVIERNARTRFGELDLVALGGGVLVFAEVKTLRGHGAEVALRALDSIGPRKRAQVRRLARAWLAERPRPGFYAAIRFDAIGVALAPRAAHVEHVEAAF